MYVVVMTRSGLADRTTPTNPVTDRPCHRNCGGPRPINPAHPLRRRATSAELAALDLNATERNGPSVRRWHSRGLRAPSGSLPLSRSTRPPTWRPQVDRLLKCDEDRYEADPACEVAECLTDDGTKGSLLVLGAHGVAWSIGCGEKVTDSHRMR